MSIDDQIAENLGLVYTALGHFSLSEDPDAISFAYEALYKAILTYDNSKGTALSTYATCIISNALRSYLRNKSKQRQIVWISLHTPLSNDEDSGYLIDTIGTTEGAEDIVCLMELQRAAVEKFDKLLSKIQSESQRAIILAWRDSNYEATQAEIASTVNVSQAAVSRTISNFKHKLYLELEDYL